MTDNQPVDYRGSTFRRLLSWILYPVLVLMPFAWLTINLDTGNTGQLLIFAYISLLTTGVLEWVHPYVRDWRHSRGDVITDILHQLLTSFIAQLLRVFLVVAFFLLIDAATEDFALVSWPWYWPLWAQALLGLVLVEFGDYWRHRLFHEWPLAWRAHAVHHSATRVYFLNAERFHIIDACVFSLVGGTVLALCGANHEVVLLVGVFTGLHSPWQHANIHYKLGCLNWVLAGAELHRWHHSTSKAECNNNYGNNLIVWDALFRTRFLPADRAIPADVGLGGRLPDFPRSWWGQQIAPFRQL